MSCVILVLICAIHFWIRCNNAQEFLVSYEMIQEKIDLGDTPYVPKTLRFIYKNKLIFLVGSHLRLLLCIHFTNLNVKSKLLVNDMWEEKGGVWKSAGHLIHDEDYILHVFGMSKVSVVVSANFTF